LESKLAPNNQPPTLEGNTDTNVKAEAQSTKLHNYPTTSPQLVNCRQISGLGIQRDQASALWIEAYHKLSDDRINLENDKQDKLQVLQELLDIADKAKQKCISD